MGTDIHGLLEPSSALFSITEARIRLPWSTQGNGKLADIIENRCLDIIQALFVYQVDDGNIQSFWLEM